MMFRFVHCVVWMVQRWAVLLKAAYCAITIYVLLMQVKYFVTKHPFYSR